MHEIRTRLKRGQFLALWLIIWKQLGSISSSDPDRHMPLHEVFRFYFFIVCSRKVLFFFYFTYIPRDTILWSNFIITRRVDVLQVFVYYINVLIFTNFEWDFFCFSRIIPISFASSSCFFEKSARRILLMIWRHGYK